MFSCISAKHNIRPGGTFYREKNTEREHKINVLNNSKLSKSGVY